MVLPFPRRKDSIQVVRNKIASDITVNTKKPGYAGCIHAYPAHVRLLDKLRQEWVHARIRKCRNCLVFRLLAEAKAFNNLVIPIWLPAIEIVQQAPALVHHHDEPAA
jgi:hypothetical protein